MESPQCRRAQGMGCPAQTRAERSRPLCIARVATGNVAPSPRPGDTHRAQVISLREASKSWRRPDQAQVKSVLAVPESVPTPPQTLEQGTVTKDEKSGRIVG